ncbi:unnamed protein product, partial [Lota lota]
QQMQVDPHKLDLKPEFPGRPPGAPTSSGLPLPPPPTTWPAPPHSSQPRQVRPMNSINSLGGARMAAHFMGISPIPGAERVPYPAFRWDPMRDPLQGPGHPQAGAPGPGHVAEERPAPPSGGATPLRGRALAPGPLAP